MLSELRFGRGSPSRKHPRCTRIFRQKTRCPIARGGLYGCRRCSLHWRHPHLGKGELEALYRLGDTTFWQYQPAKRIDWQIARELIARDEGIASVLDVGCFDGQFLDYLGAGYDRAGIEVHPYAAERAEAKGIRIVGHDFCELNASSSGFDAVLAMDVIEHVANPLELLQSMARATRTGGLVIISTGNTAAWSWRLMRGMYWYCSIAEHLSFINLKWCEYASQKLGLEIINFRTFSHEPARASDAFLQASSNLFYRHLPTLGTGLRHFYARLKGLPSRHSFETPPHWRSAKDHLLVAFRVHPQI